MTEFGLAINLVGSVYTLTIIPAFAYLANFGFAKRPDN